MFMKKKQVIIVASILLILIVVGVFVVIKINYNNEIKRYEEIRNNVKKEAIAYLTIMQRIDISKEKYLYEDDIVNPLKRGADKNIILDIDKESYCQVAIKGFVKDNKWDADVYLKCKKHEDKLYEDTIVRYMCINGVPKGYEDYYQKYGIEYDNFVCPTYIEEKSNK